MTWEMPAKLRASNGFASTSRRKAARLSARGRPPPIFPPSVAFPAREHDMSIEAIFATFPRWETERLILRQIQFSDADAVFVTFSDEAVMEFYGEIPQRSVDESRELIRRQHEWYAQREGIRWGITRKGEDMVIGSCGFFKFDEEFQRAEIGYELAQAY